MANNDIHYIRKELDNLQTRIAKFEVRTEYALSLSDVDPPTTGWSEEKPAPTEGYFIWARNIMNLGYGDIITEPFCIGDGQEHILSIDVEYIAWNDPYQAPPQDSPYWQTTAPSIIAGQYIWTRSVIETTNGTNYTDPVRVTGLQGERGNDGIDGKAGKDGKGLEFIFYRSASQIDWNNPPSGVINPASLSPVQTDDYVPNGWTDDQDEVTEQLPYQYVSTRTKIVATGQTSANWTAFNTPKLWSVYGEKPYCHIRYADVNNPTNWNETFPYPQTSGQSGLEYHKYEGYLWNADETLKDVDKDPTKFSWRIYRPTIGVAGEEGSFLHIAYANDDQGTGFNQYEGAYMGTCITWEEEDPDDPTLYNWVKIEGNGIDYIEEQYALHTSYSTAPTSGWQSTKPTYVLGKYYWTRSIIHYTDGTSEQSAPMCVSGLDGTGVNNVFYCSDSLSTPNTPSWSDIHDKSSTPSQNYNKWIHDPVDITSTYRYIYISTSTTHVYTNGVKSWTNFSAPVLWGRYALDGSSITNVVNYYATTTTATAPAKTSSVWKTNVSQVTFDSTYKYLWNYEETKSGDTVITSTTPVTIAYYSTDGAKGDAGKGIVSIVEYYAVNDGTTAPADSSFSTNVVNTTPQNPYLWNYEVINFTEGNPYKSSKRIIGTHGKSGDNGTGYEYVYYTSNSATAPTKPTGDITATSGTGKWTKVPVPMTTTYKYMYISYRTIVGTTKSAWSNSALWSQFGEKGEQGDKGVDGKGLEHIFYRSNTEVTSWTGDTNPSNWSTTGDFQNDDYVKPNTGWTDDANGVDSTHKYEYCSIRTKEPNSSGVGVWQPFNPPVLQNIYSAPITQVINYYLATSSTTAPSTSPISNWATSPTDNKAKMTATNQYLWNFEVIKDIDGNTVNTTTPCMIGRYGQNGTNGIGIDHVEEYYAVNNNKDSAPAWTSFTTTVVTTNTNNRYLWNYEKIYFTSGNPHTSDRRIISTHGETGEKGDTGLTGVHGDNISSSMIIDKASNESFVDTSVGSIANSVPSDFVGSNVKSVTLTASSTECVDSSKIASGSVTVSRMGNLVVINFRNLNVINIPVDTSTSGVHTPLFNLPSWARPSEIHYFASVTNTNVLSASTTQLRVRKLDNGTNLSGTATYFVDSDVGKTPTIIGRVGNTAINQGGKLYIRLLDGSQRNIVGVPIYIRINGQVYRKITDANGVATLTINLNEDQYYVVAWFDGGNYAYGGVYVDNIGGYGYAQWTGNVDVGLATAGITFGSDDNGYYALFRNTKDSSNYPIRYHRVVFNINNTGEFNAQTDGNGKAYYKLTGMSGTVTVKAKIYSSSRVGTGAESTKTHNL